MEQSKLRAEASAQYFYDYAGQDPINGYDLSGTSMAWPSPRIGFGWGFGFLLAVASGCAANPAACSSGNSIIIKKIAEIVWQAKGDSNSTKVKDILPQIEGSAKQQIDPRIRDNPDLTLGDVRGAAKTGQLPGGVAIPKAVAGKAKKILTDNRFRKGM